MGSSGEKRGVKLDRTVSSAASFTLPPEKARKIKDRPRLRKQFKLYRNKKCRHNRNRHVFPTKSTLLSLKLKSLSETCYTWCSMCSTDRSKRISSGRYTFFDPAAIERSTTRLSNLLNKNKITLDQSMRAIKKFHDYTFCILWLKMNLDKQVEYVKSLGDQGDEFIQGSSSNNQQKSTS